MRSLLALVVSFLLFTTAARAAQPLDRVLTEGLASVQANGVDAGLRVWFADRPQLAAEMSQKLLRAAVDLGSVVDTEVVAVQPISKRVTRYYVAIYFTRCPMWLRVERYSNGEQAFYLPLRFSTDPDVILPGYLTEFRVP